MILLFILNIALVLMGLVYTTRVIYFRARHDQLASKYKPGTIAHMTFQRDTKPIALPIAITITLASIVSLIALARNIVQRQGDQGVAIVQGGSVIALLTTTFCLILAYRLFRNK